MTTILIKKKDTAGAPASGDLTNAAGGAEIAVNTATKRIYSKDSGGTVIEMGTFPSTMAVQGALSATGNVTLGDASADSVTVNGTITSNLIFTDATYDIGASGATRPRDLFLSRNLTVGGTLTLAGGVNLNGNVTVGDASTDTLTINSTITSNLIFTDNTYDIGASGATRPRTGYFGTSLITPLIDATNVEVTNIKALDGTASISLANTTGIATFSKATVISTTDNTNAALRITQLGTGNALLVEDTTNPDASPFVIDASGNVIVGTTASITNGVVATTPVFQEHGLTNNSSSIGLTNWSSTAARTPSVNFNRSAGNAVGTRVGITTAGTAIGTLSFSGDDGTNWFEAARIEGLLDATGGTSDMPGRLVFSTTADGASTVTERMRIDSAGQTKFSYNAVVEVTDNTNAALRITQTGTGNALLVEDSTNPDSSPFVIDASGNTVVGYTAPIATVSFAGGAITPLFQVQGTGLNSSSAGVSNWSGTAASASSFVFSKSNSGTIGTRGVVASATNLGSINFAGDDGTNFISAASILVAVDGTPGTNDMPGRLVFSTTADGASTPTERVRIDSSGNVGIGTSSSSPNFDLHISTGSTASITQPTAGSYGLYIQQNSSGSVGGLYIQDGASNSGNSIVVADNNNAARFVVGPDGDVIIGGGAENGAFTVRNASASKATGGFLATNTSGPNFGVDILSYATAANTTALIRGYSGTGSPSQVFNLNGSGNISQFGGQITFPATQSASANANTLDDYEEGDWTPTIVGSTTNPTVTYSSQTGKYTKIGRVCYIMCVVLMSSYSGGSGRVLVTGLPFTAGANGIGNGALSNTLVSYMDMPAGYSYITNYVDPSTTNFNWLQSGDNVVYRDMLVGEFQTATTFIVSGFYIVA